jgi:hypothetical protein
MALGKLNRWVPGKGSFLERVTLVIELLRFMFGRQERLMHPVPPGAAISHSPAQNPRGVITGVPRPYETAPHYDLAARLFQRALWWSQGGGMFLVGQVIRKSFGAGVRRAISLCEARCRRTDGAVL